MHISYLQASGRYFLSQMVHSNIRRGSHQHLRAVDLVQHPYQRRGCHRFPGARRALHMRIGDIMSAMMCSVYRSPVSII
jgi:hypothetical protein